MRLGASPATSTPTGFFSQVGFEALFFHAGTLGCVVSLTPQLFLLVYPHANMRPLLCPSCPSPPLPLVWMNVSSLTLWLSEFHTVLFSGSSGSFCFKICCCIPFGCASRQNESAYTSILARRSRFPPPFSHTSV